MIQGLCSCLSGDANWVWNRQLYNRHVDPNHVYIDNDNDDNNNNQKIFALFNTNSNGQKHHEKFVLSTITAMICGIIMCSIYYCYKKWKNKRRLQRLSYNDDITPLISKWKIIVTKIMIIL